jgi:hypothetical protein
MPRRELLSDEQRTDLLALPADEAEFIRRALFISPAKA